MRIKLTPDAMLGGAKMGMHADSFEIVSDRAGTRVVFYQGTRQVATLSDGGIRLDRGDVLTVTGLSMVLDFSISEA